jgi:apolipoprotein N-acyltransferase
MKRVSIKQIILKEKNTIINLFIFFVCCLFFYLSHQGNLIGVYLLGMPVYFLLARLQWLERMSFGAIYGIFGGGLYLGWVSRAFNTDPEFYPFILVLFVWGLLFSFIFLISGIIIKKASSSLFAIFSFSWLYYIVHYVLSYIQNYQTFFFSYLHYTYLHWLQPYIGQGAVKALIWGLGFTVACLILNRKNIKKLKNITIVLVVYICIISIGIIKDISDKQVIQNNNENYVNIALIQGNFPFAWSVRQLGVDVIFEQYYSNTLKEIKNGAKIIFWPEYAIPEDIIANKPDMHKRLLSLSQDKDVVLVVGSLQYNSNKKYYDTALVYDPEKGILEPYRSIFPWEFDDTLKGDTLKIFQTKFGNFAVIICFEGTFPAIYKQYFDMDTSIDFIAHIGNYQNFDFTNIDKGTAMGLGNYAAEYNRYIISTTNTGPSIILNNRGKILNQLSRSTITSSTYRIQKINQNSFYSQFGETIAVIIVLMYGFLLFRRYKKSYN